MIIKCGYGKRQISCVSQACASARVDISRINITIKDVVESNGGRKSDGHAEARGRIANLRRSGGMEE